MRMYQVVWWLFIFPFPPSAAQDGIVFRDDSLDVGSPCTNPSGRGTCMFLENCGISIREMYNRQPSICYFHQQRIPVICCPTDNVINLNININVQQTPQTIQQIPIMSDYPNIPTNPPSAFPAFATPATSTPPATSAPPATTTDLPRPQSVVPVISNNFADKSPDSPTDSPSVSSGVSDLSGSSTAPTLPQFPIVSNEIPSQVPATSSESSNISGGSADDQVPPENSVPKPADKIPQPSIDSPPVPSDFPGLLNDLATTTPFHVDLPTDFENDSPDSANLLPSSSETSVPKPATTTPEPAIDSPPVPSNFPGLLNDLATPDGVDNLLGNAPTKEHTTSSPSEIPPIDNVSNSLGSASVPSVANNFGDLSTDRDSASVTPTSDLDFLTPINNITHNITFDPPDSTQVSVEATTTVETPRVIRVSTLKCRDYSQNYTEDSNKATTKPVSDIDTVDGGFSVLGEFPHTASIAADDPEDENGLIFYCGGTLISERYVLTAAHCFVRDSPTTVRLGGLDLDTDHEKNNIVDLGIESVSIHPNFRAKAVYDDLALIRLSDDVIFNDIIRPACLNDRESSNGPVLTTIGWGNAAYSGRTSRVLQKARVKTVPLEQCSVFYPSTRGFTDSIVNTQICVTAKSSASVANPCISDSGATLSTAMWDANISANIYHVIGLMSYGRGCENTAPYVFTRVYSYLDWIEKIVWNTTDISQLNNN